jgi:hypothetical protein
MPGVDAPVAASSISLRSRADEEFDPDNSEFNAETELIDFAHSFERSA